MEWPIRAMRIQTCLAGEFRSAVVAGSFTVFEGDVTFTSTASSEGIFAEMGRERNGSFLEEHDDEKE